MRNVKELTILAEKLKSAPGNEMERIFRDRKVIEIQKSINLESIGFNEGRQLLKEVRQPINCLRIERNETIYGTLRGIGFGLKDALKVTNHERAHMNVAAANGLQTWVEIEFTANDKNELFFHPYAIIEVPEHKGDYISIMLDAVNAPDELSKYDKELNEKV